MDIGDIITTAIGAFLGFLFAFWLQAIIDGGKKKQSIINVKRELEELYSLLEATKDDHTVSNEIYVPIWDAVVGNGDILCYIKEKYYNQLIETYSHILSLKELEQSLAYIQDEREQSHRINAIVNKRKIVYEKIKSLDINRLK
jgi:hypothetical protein